MRDTTWYAQSGWITGNIANAMKSSFLALIVHHRRHGLVATNTTFLDTPAVDDGSTCAQLLGGLSTKYCEVCGMKTNGEFMPLWMLYTKWRDR